MDIFQSEFEKFARKMNIQYAINGIDLDFMRDNDSALPETIKAELRSAQDNVDTAWANRDFNQFTKALNNLKVTIKQIIEAYITMRKA